MGRQIVAENQRFPGGLRQSPRDDDRLEPSINYAHRESARLRSAPVTQRWGKGSEVFFFELGLGTDVGRKAGAVRGDRKHY